MLWHYIKFFFILIKRSNDDLSTVKPPTALTDWVTDLALVPTEIPQRHLNPAHTSQHQGCFVTERQLFVWLCSGLCGPPLLWVSFSFVPFFKSLFSWGRQEATETTESFVTFYISLLVTGLTSPQGTRGTEKGEKKSGWNKKG